MSEQDKSRSQRRRLAFGCVALLCLVGAGTLAASNLDDGLLHKDFACYQLEDSRECAMAGMIHEGRGDHDQAERYYRRACELFDDGGCVHLMELAATHHREGRNERAIRLAIDACSHRVSYACQYARRWRAENPR
jgi:TPR repeat protein